MTLMKAVVQSFLVRRPPGRKVIDHLKPMSADDVWAGGRILDVVAVRLTAFRIVPDLVTPVEQTLHPAARSAGGEFSDQHRLA